MDDNSEWLQAASKRLVADGFEVREDLPYAGETLRMVAHRSRFEWSKFGNSETLFVFAEIELATVEELNAFSAEAFDFAMENKKSSRPCGFFEAVYCFPVALTESLDETTARSIRETTPPSHWAAAEIPVVYDTATGDLTYFMKTPIWGAAYYAGFRKTIRKYLQGG